MYQNDERNNRLLLDHTFVKTEPMLVLEKRYCVWPSCRQSTAYEMKAFFGVRSIPNLSTCQLLLWKGCLYYVPLLQFQLDLFLSHRHQIRRRKYVSNLCQHRIVRRHA